VTCYNRKYKSISRRKFILSTASAIAGITVAGAVTSSCTDKRRQTKLDVLEVDYIGPESYFPIYHSHFKKFTRTSLHFKTLEEALFTNSDGAIVLLPLTQKAPVILMLLEMEKDILTPFPLAKDYEEFDALQRQCNISDRRIAMLDPVRFWEPVQYLTNQIQGKIESVHHVELTINPDYPGENYLPAAGGFSGNAAGLIRMISCILGRNPYILKTGNGLDIEVNYNGISLLCRTDNKSDGWSVAFSGDGLNLSLNSEGILKGIDKITGEDNPGWDKAFKLQAFTKNIGDFVTTIRSRKEPEINSIDGMSGIALTEDLHP
jgi:predicted dehydrogenase